MSSQEPVSPRARRQSKASSDDGGGDDSVNGPGKKKRVRNWTADDRAAHRVFERSRREAFKGRLTKLAGFIPALNSTEPSRLSKHVVIDESIALHREEQQKIADTQKLLEALTTERDELLDEVNRWRTGAGLSMRPPGLGLPPLSEDEEPHAEPPFALDHEWHEGENPGLMPAVETAPAGGQAPFSGMNPSGAMLIPQGPDDGSAALSHLETAWDTHNPVMVQSMQTQHGMGPRDIFVAGVTDDVSLDELDTIHMTGAPHDSLPLHMINQLDFAGNSHIYNG